jgi:STE24 endopeptidase
MTTVWPVDRRQWVQALAALVAPTAAAALAARVLRPRRELPPIVPVAARTQFTAQELRRGAAFTRPQILLSTGAGAIELAVLVALARRRRALDWSGPGPRGGALAGGTMSLALAALTLPVRALGRRRALRAGLATQGWRGWAGDTAKAGLLSAAAAAAGGAGILWVVERHPGRWWLPAAGLSLATGAGVGTLAPVLLDPLFNRFEALEGQPREDVLALAAKAQVRLKDVLRVDASRRTTAVNAYVGGLGPTRRMVLFDTLLDRYARDELCSVIAHELAHVRGRDVGRSLTLSALFLPTAAWGVQRLLEVAGCPLTSGADLPALVLAAGVVTAPGGLLAGSLSRAVERRADAVALELTDDPQAFIRLERRLALENLADLDPPRWVRLARGTHPTTVERIGMALGFAGAGAEVCPLALGPYSSSGSSGGSLPTSGRRRMSPRVDHLE